MIILKYLIAKLYIIRDLDYFQIFTRFFFGKIGLYTFAIIQNSDEMQELYQINFFPIIIEKI